MGPTCAFVCVCVYVRQRENMCERMRPAYLAPSPVLDVCEGCVTELRGPCARRQAYCTCAAEGLAMQEKSLCSGVLSYIMCLLLQVMMQVIIMHGMRRRHLELDPGELLA